MTVRGCLGGSTEETAVENVNGTVAEDALFCWSWWYYNRRRRRVPLLTRSRLSGGVLTGIFRMPIPGMVQGTGPQNVGDRKEQDHAMICTMVA